MSANLEHHIDRIYALYIGGLLRKSELDAAQDKLIEELAKQKPVKVLVVLENFLGWEKGADWGDTDFFFEHRDDFEKIAIVGDNRWEAEALAFTGVGLRKGPVRFFLASDKSAALDWLAYQPNNQT